MISSSPKIFDRTFPARRGFTLVELLVAVGLMVLLMMMFAQIFGMAAGIMRDQKGLAENDQRARNLTTVIRSDLEHRTFREVMPFLKGTDTDDQVLFPKGALEKKKGYFSYSENDPNNDTDDVLRLTVSSTASPKPNVDQTPYYGKAVKFKEITDLTFGPNSTPNPPPDLNQPAADDGVFTTPATVVSPFTIVADNLGSAPSAEIIYFLRGDRLYRRVLAIREPYDGTEDQPDFLYDIDTTDNSTLPGPTPPVRRRYFEVGYPHRLDSGSPNVNVSFWRDYDYSAFIQPTTSPGPRNPATDRAMFHGQSSLKNENSGGGPITDPKLGIPAFRFGFSSVPPATADHSISFKSHPPREFISTSFGGDQTFIGGFTLAETSHNDFVYPGGYPSAVTVDQNPYFRISQMVLNSEGAVAAFRDYDLNNEDGTIISPPAAIPPVFRMDEDILMSNVHSFDIKIFDPIASRGADNQNGIALVNEDADSLIDATDSAELGWPGSDDGAWKDLGWSPAVNEIGMYSSDSLLAECLTPAGSIGDPSGYCAPMIPSGIPQYRFDTWSPDSEMTTAPPFWSMRYLPNSVGTFVGTNPLQMIGNWTANQGYNPGDVVFPTSVGKKYRFAYKCVTGGTSDLTSEPTWPTVDGNSVLDGTVTWLAIDNWRPLRGIQIKIRYVDLPTDQMREVTIVHSLVDQ